MKQNLDMTARLSIDAQPVPIEGKSCINPSSGGWHVNLKIVRRASATAQLCRCSRRRNVWSASAVQNPFATDKEVAARIWGSQLPSGLYRYRYTIAISDS